jgi:recombination protein RecT
MSEQTAITPYVQLKTMMSSDEVQARFSEVLGKRAPAFMASVLSAVYSSKQLRDCDPNSVMTSAMKAAVLDLPIDDNLGFSYIIGYNSRDGKKAQFQMGYKGFIQLALRTGQYQTINTAAIYDGEEVREDRLTGQIILNGQRTSDEVIGYVAYFKLLTGFEKFYYMTVEEIREHAAEFSKSYKKPTGPWTTHFEAMAKKTVLKHILSKYGVLTVQMSDVIKEDNNGFQSLFGNEDDIEGEILDIEYEPQDEPQYEQQEEPVVSVGADFEDQLIFQAIESDLTENEFSAKATLSKCTATFNDIESGLSWFKLYRGWRDMGADSNKAAELANKSEVPN